MTGAAARRGDNTGHYEGETMSWPGGDHVISTPEHPEPSLADDFVPTEELARRQGVRPIATVDGLAAAVDPFESDEEYEPFLADLYASRRAGLA
jgi:hypothetical protein